MNIADDFSEGNLLGLEGLEVLAKDYEANLKRDYSFACFEAMSYASIARQQIELGDHEGAFHSTAKFQKAARDMCQLMRRLDSHLKREGIVK
jgi:hypothetical protein